MRRNKFNFRRFERLEDRRLMAADIDLDNGILTIEGTDGRDSIEVAISQDDPDELIVTIKDRDTLEVLEQEDYDLEDVQQIISYGLGSNDFLANFTNISAQLYGGNGDDTLVSGPAGDLLDGGANNDNLTGGGGNDDLIGGSGSDKYWFVGGQLGTDTIQENASVDVDALDFRFFSGPINVNLAATSEQIVRTNHLRLRLTSDTGIENVNGTDFSDRIYGNARDNVFSGFGSSDYLYGQGAADDLFGGEGNDFLYGEAGLDDLFGEGGDDDLFGGSDRDILRGGIGNDDLFGEAGNDDLYGEAGVDNLDGGADADYLDGGYFPTFGTIVRDQLTGGAGVDTFVRHRKQLQRDLRFEDFRDFNSAIDRVFEVWH